MKTLGRDAEYTLKYTGYHGEKDDMSNGNVILPVEQPCRKVLNEKEVTLL